MTEITTKNKKSKQHLYKILESAPTRWEKPVIEEITTNTPHNKVTAQNERTYTFRGSQTSVGPS